MDPSVAAIQAHLQALVLPPWPVYALPDGGWLAGVSEDSSGAISRIRMDHRPPGAAQRLMVQTQPDETRPIDLTHVLDQLNAPDTGEPLTLATTSAPAGTPTEILVDDRPTAALTWEQDGRTVWSTRTDDVLVIVAARAVPLDQVSLARVRDLAPYRHRRTEEINRYLTA